MSAQPQTKWDLLYTGPWHRLDYKGAVFELQSSAACGGIVQFPCLHYDAGLNRSVKYSLRNIEQMNGLN